MTRALRTAAVVVAAGVLFVLLLLPAGPTPLDASAWADLAARTIPGAYHVHTTRSDGAARKAAVAAAAGRAGLRFVLFTDHGDGTRPPDPPAYLDGVLCLDAVEVSTDDGHYVAIDMPRAPYPLGGRADAVAEDVERLGGFGVAAHPDSPKPALQWRDRDVQPDGVEWINADSEWRGAGYVRLGRAGVGYLFRSGPALAMLLARPTASLARWDAMTRTRPVVGLGALDAHGGVGGRTEEGGRAGVFGIPSYEASFRTFSNRVILERPLTGEPAADAAAVYAAIRAGRLFTTVDALAAPGLLDFHADAAGKRFEMGTELPPNTRATLVARALAPPGARIVLLNGGRELQSTPAAELRYDVTGARGAYRVEVRLASAPAGPPVPWLVGNPIYFLEPRSVALPEAGPPVLGEGPRAPALSWQIERDQGSSAILRTRDGETELEYTLKPGEVTSQYVAAAARLAHGAGFSRLRFHARASRPMRVSVQLRFPGGLPERRWGRSLYVPPDGRWMSLAVTDLVPMDAGEGAMPDPRTATSVLLVIDLTNSSPGASGHLWFSDVEFQEH